MEREREKQKQKTKTTTEICPLREDPLFRLLNMLYNVSKANCLYAYVCFVDAQVKALSECKSNV